MAGHLIKNGYNLFVFNRTKSKADSLLKLGAIYVDSPKELAK
jgi:3-hydroxyisobutyrate dehydrogenase